MYSNILLPIDLDDPHSWSRPLAIAVELAQAHGAALHLTNVVPSFGMSLVSQYFPAGYEDQMIAKARERLTAFRRDHVPDDVPGSSIVAQGSVHREVVAKAAELKCDLVIIGHGRDPVAHFILGSNGTRIVNESDVSVLIVR